MSEPATHIDDSLGLTGDGIVYLFTVTLPLENVTFRFKNNDTVTWQGQVYEGLPCQLQGEARTSDDAESRPSLRIYNPGGIFNDPAIEGRLYRGIVTRKRVLRTHLENNNNIYIQRQWFIERPRELVSGQYITLELRDMSEGPNFQIPVRQYIPPQFPTVSL